MATDTSMFLEFQVTRTESNLEDAAQLKEGTIGSAAARDATDFSLTFSDSTEHALVTDKPITIRIQIPESLLCMVPKEKRDCLMNGMKDKAGSTIVLSTRARLNIKTLRSCASINGTYGKSMSGEGSVFIKDLFTDKQPAGSLIQEMEEEVNLDTCLDNVQSVEEAHVPVPFATVTIKYPNWGQHQAVVTVFDASVVRMHENEVHKIDTIVWWTDKNDNNERTKVHPLMQKLYDESWKVSKQIPFILQENLSKSVMRVCCGYDSSKYALSSAVNDMPPSYSATAHESVLMACLRLELNEDRLKVCLDALSTPSVQGTIEWASSFANAISTFNAYVMPYRIDGTPMVMPNGLKMVPSESWRKSAAVSLEQMDDCDGTAAGAVAIIMFAVWLLANTEVTEMDHYPALRALANSIGAHYVYGTTVLAANAGHADNANEEASTVAGHAIATAIPKISFLMALEEGSKSHFGEDKKLVTPENILAEVTKARFEALYPKELQDRMSTRDKENFESYEVLKYNLHDNLHETKRMDPYAMEGTAWASSVMFTHTEQERNARRQYAERSAFFSQEIMSNISRPRKTLDVSPNGSHAFYRSFVEIGVSMYHPLFTSETLRNYSHASALYRFTQMPTEQYIIEAGASPEQIATQKYALVPMWKVNEEDAAILDAANLEADANTMPTRRGPFQMDDNHMENLDKNIESLRNLEKYLNDNCDENDTEQDKNGDPIYKCHIMHHIFSFACLVNNAASIKAFVENVKAANNVCGTVTGLDNCLKHVAVYTGNKKSTNHENGGDCARMIVVELRFPLP